MQDKIYAISAAMVRERSYLSKMFPLGYPGWSVYMGKISSQLQRSRSQKLRSTTNRASPGSIMNRSKLLRRKEWQGEISETEAARLTGLI